MQEYFKGEVPDFVELTEKFSKIWSLRNPKKVIQKGKNYFLLHFYRKSFHEF